ncbi:WecB/TagA/CpsF family glycosyltransferase [Candidatus Parcubacteria bacterium]|nr:WecB/TagA/CpsF family glycosyltransferase [Candidatus Parcubacteria bacterium]
MREIKILGVKINSITKKQALEKIEQFLCSGRQCHIATINPEFLVEARKDKEFFDILNSADLSLADGFGLILASYFFNPKIKERIAGSDLMDNIFNIAEKKYYKICILNWKNGLSKKQKIGAVLKNRHPRLKFIIKDVRRDYFDLDTKEINSFAPQILIVGLGAPYQEKLIHYNLSKMPSVKIAIGIGGALDFLTGRISRAPSFIKRIGLEWLWRLFNQPEQKIRRLKRIFIAVVVFPFLILLEKFKKIKS